MKKNSLKKVFDGEEGGFVETQKPPCRPGENEVAVEKPHLRPEGINVETQKPPCRPGENDVKIEKPFYLPVGDEVGVEKPHLPPEGNNVEAQKPFYLPVGDEVEVFEAAYKSRMAMLLKGPTGCGKTRFVRYMAHRLGLSVHTVACHDDLTGSDLVGRYLIKGGETVWIDGPLTRAVRQGGICYLDEVVEARKDTTVIIHPLTDDRRILTVEKTGEELHAPADFMLVISYNPGYQHILKDLKPSTRQRFAALEFDYPPEKLETEIVSLEGGLDKERSRLLVSAGRKIRTLTESGLEAPPCTRLLVHCARLMTEGLGPRTAADATIVRPITEDNETRKAMLDIIDAIF